MKQKRTIIFQTFIWASVLHLPLLALALHYGYNLIHFGWLGILYVFVFRYINHRYFDVHWILNYLEDEISNQTKRIDKLLVWAQESEEDEDKLEALQKLWELDTFDAVRKRIEEDLALAKQKLEELETKHNEVLSLKEQTFAEYAQTHLWH